MKIISYVLCVIQGMAAIYLLISSDSERGIFLMCILLLLSIIFFLFAVLEEQKEKTEELRSHLQKMKEYYMIEEPKKISKKNMWVSIVD